MTETAQLSRVALAVHQKYCHLSVNIYMEVRNCKKHGDQKHFPRKGTNSWRCGKCSSEAVDKRRKKIKRLLVEEHGGACIICRYDRYYGSLDFHHVDPKEKNFSISEKGLTRSLARAQAEARKCVLLCRNCHSEVENGITNIPV